MQAIWHDHIGIWFNIDTVHFSPVPLSQTGHNGPSHFPPICLAVRQAGESIGHWFLSLQAPELVFPFFGRSHGLVSSSLSKSIMYKNHDTPNWEADLERGYICSVPIFAVLYLARCLKVNMTYSRKEFHKELSLFCPLGGSKLPMRSRIYLLIGKLKIEKLTS
jgi:hypothetical protein